MADRFCNHRWHAPRFDVPGSLDVEHVCAKPFGHDDREPGTGVLYHECTCGQTSP